MKMTGTRCIVSACSNSRSRTTNSPGVKIIYHKFPANKEQRRLWIECFRQNGPFNPDNHRVCSSHFADNDYRRDLKAELLNIPAKRVLKQSAVPSLGLGAGRPWPSTARSRGHKVGGDASSPEQPSRMTSPEPEVKPEEMDVCESPGWPSPEHSDMKVEITDHFPLESPPHKLASSRVAPKQQPITDHFSPESPPHKPASSRVAPKQEPITDHFPPESPPHEPASSRVAPKQEPITDHFPPESPPHEPASSRVAPKQEPIDDDDVSESEPFELLLLPDVRVKLETSDADDPLMNSTIIKDDRTLLQNCVELSNKSPEKRDVEDSCNLVCKTMLSLQAPELRLKCNKCEECFTCDILLRAHYDTHTKKRAHVCKRCNSSFADEKSLSEHSCRRGPLVCKVSGETFTTSESVHAKCCRKHRRSECDECHGTEIDLGLLPSQRDSHFVCNVCARSFGSGIELNIHIQTNTCRIVKTALNPLVSQIESQRNGNVSLANKHCSPAPVSAHFPAAKTASLVTQINQPSVDERVKENLDGSIVFHRTDVLSDNPAVGGVVHHRIITEPTNVPFIFLRTSEARSIRRTDQAVLPKKVNEVCIGRSSVVQRNHIAVNTEVITKPSINRIKSSRVSAVTNENVADERIALTSSVGPSNVTESTKVSYGCIDCEVSVGNKSESVVQSHSRIHPSVESCGDRLQTESPKSGHDRHKKTHERGYVPTRSKQRKYDCDECGLSFTERRRIVRHLNSEHPTKERSTLTDHVASITQRVGSLTERLASDRVPLRLEAVCFKCDKCGELFKELKDARRHMKEVHLGTSCVPSDSRTSGTPSDSRTSGAPIKSKPHVCPECGEQFRDPQGLREHVASTHANERNFRCSHCSDTFTTRSNLSRHLRVHAKQFKCSQCDKCYGTLYNLRLHERVHSDPTYRSDPTNCELFLQYLSGLKVRTRTSVVCDECGKRCASKSSLVAHLRRHAGGNPLECGKSNASKAGLI